MITEKAATKLSKFLSLVLRHKPELIGIKLDENGWTETAVLITRANTAGIHLDKDLLQYIVDNNSKKRFAFSNDKSRIRASQGHSVHVDLGYTPQQPPAVLYHGTGEKAVDAIMKNGLQKRNRYHVHLSNDKTTAVHVGSRHGKPVVLQIAADEMFKDGFVFMLSANQVWLTEQVPPHYLRLIK